MKDIDNLNKIITELKSSKNLTPNFTTSRNGIQIGFSSDFLKLVKIFAKKLYNNDKTLYKIDFDNLLKITKQSIVDFYTEKRFDNFDDNKSEILKQLKEYIINSTSKEIKKFTYYIPVKTLGFEQLKTFSFVDIEIVSQKNLISNEIKILNNKSYQKIDYKKYINDNINNKEDIEELEEPIKKQLDSLSNAIKVSKSFIKIDIQGYDSELSFQLANIVAKTTLDSISLIIGNQDLFYQQILISDKSLPTMNYKLLKIDGNLMLPGMNLSPVISMISPKKACDLLNDDKNKIFVDAISKVLISIKDSNQNHTKLSNRWATALNWYAEGMREDNDAIALTKLATSLDVLSKGGKNKGILSMLVKIFGITENDTIVDNLTLKEFVKEIYDNQRSKILHGTEYERLKSFKHQKKIAIPIIRKALLICLIELFSYKGDDFDGNFIKIIEENSMLENRKCPVCNSENKEIIFTQTFNDILGISLDKFEQNIAICKDCGMAYTTPFVNDEELNNYYSNMSNYEHSHTETGYPDEDINKSERQFKYIETQIKNQKSILDVGCAVGYTLSLFKDAGYATLGLEPSAKNKQIAKEKYGVEVETRFLDKDGLDGRVFDVVTLSHVAEHLKHPLDIFKNIRNILSDDGMLFIETPNIDFFDEQDLYQFSFEHINYFNIDSTKNLLQRAGFELVDSKIFYNDKSTAPFYPTLGTIWKKSEKSFEIASYYEKNRTTIQRYIDLINNFRGTLVSKIDNIISSHKNIAIWAAGTLTSQLLSQTNLAKGDIKAIFDNDSKKDGLKMENITIKKPTMNVEYFKEKNIEAIVIGSWSSQDEIYDSLKFLEDSGIKVFRLFE